MSGKAKKAITWFAVIALGAVAWALYDLRAKPANEQIQNGIQQIIHKEPRVRPLYDEAMKDGVLTSQEANEIVDKATAIKGR